MPSLLASNRARLILLLVVATAAISVLAFKAASGAVSYYLEPHEFLENAAYQGTRVRVAGRVVEGSVTEVAGRPVAFDIAGDQGDQISVSFEHGEVPNLFGPYALVVVEGEGQPGGHINADAVIIKHEDEFFADQPPDGSISSHFVDGADAGQGD